MLCSCATLPSLRTLKSFEFFDVLQQKNTFHFKDVRFYDCTLHSFQLHGNKAGLYCNGRTLQRLTVAEKWISKDLGLLPRNLFTSLRSYREITKFKQHLGKVCLDRRPLGSLNASLMLGVVSDPTVLPVLTTSWA